MIGLFYGDLWREYYKAGDSVNAIKYLRKSIEMFALKGPDDLVYLQTKSDLAKLLRDEQQAIESQQITDEVSQEISRLLDDPSKDRNLLCALGNATNWLAVLPVDSSASPEQVSLMQKVVSIEPKGMYFNTLGATLYRAGQFKQAINACQQSVEKTPGEMGLPGPHPADFAFIAMSHHKLGNEALAEEFKDKAVAGSQAEAFKKDPEIIAIMKELQTLIPASK